MSQFLFPLLAAAALIAIFGGLRYQRGQKAWKRNSSGD